MTQKVRRDAYMISILTQQIYGYKIHVGLNKLIKRRTHTFAKAER